jgi:hypothetical protein
MTLEKYTRLGTPDQFAAERLALRLFDHPKVRAAAAATLKQMMSNPAALDPEGMSSLKRAVDIWTRSLVLRETNGDPYAPKIISDADSAAHEWFGYVYPSAQVAADNPDNIYRNAYLNGYASYVLHGRVSEPRPAQFVLELILGRPGSLVIQKSGKERVDLGNQLGILTNRDIEPDADGRFKVSIDSRPASERKYHLQSRDDCPLALLLRDTLSDWSQVPLEYRIEKVAGPSGPPLTEELIAERTLADLPEWVAFWTKFKENWMGSPSANTMATPVARDGGWGFGASGPFDLADDEALIATVSKGNAPYVSIQIIDRWLIGADPRLDFANLNLNQTTPNADGTMTYVVSVKDPGVVNWASTGGQHRGYIFLRWQGTPHGTDGSKLVREFRKVKLEDLPAALAATPLKRVSPAERETSRLQRRNQFEARLRAK